MKKTIILLTILSLNLAYGQEENKGRIGINTSSPKATLDINSITTDQAKGILIPRISAEEMKAITPNIGENQNSLLVYLTDSMPILDREENAFNRVSDFGFYFWHSTDSKWYKMVDNYYNNDDLRLVGDANHITKDAGFNGLGQTAGSGKNNIGIGKNAFKSNTTGENNIAIGTHTMENSTHAKNNIGIGLSSLQYNNTGEDNVALGNLTLNYNISGQYNVALGSVALGTNTTGSQNVAVGRGALYTNKTGIGNVGIGFEALKSNESGSNNVGIGKSSLENNTEGENNLALGHQSLTYNKTGKNNIALGSKGLYNNISGTYNVALGNSSLESNQIGNFNIAIGESSLYENYDGTNNIGIGNNSLQKNVSGKQNIAIGNSSGNYILNGNGNIHIGNASMQEDTSNNIDNIIAIGHNIVDLNIQNPIVPEQDNTILLGKMGEDGPNVGIGTYTPATKLDINGELKIGNSSKNCTPSIEGTIRFNTVTKKFQGCTGTEWVNLH